MHHEGEAPKEGSPGSEAPRGSELLEEANSPGTTHCPKPIVTLSCKSDNPLGRHKALTTCCSHLTVVSLFFGQAMFVHLTPDSSHTPKQDQIGAVLGTIVTPMLNPLIYSLRNKEVLEALKKCMGRCCD